MARGGKRPGAGRPRGKTGPQQRTREMQRIAEEAAAKGIKPLDLLLERMRQLYAAGNLDEAAKYAVMAAPYVHPKLKAIEHSGTPLLPVRIVEVLEIVQPDAELAPAA